MNVVIVCIGFILLVWAIKKANCLNCDQCPHSCKKKKASLYEQYRKDYPKKENQN